MSYPETPMTRQEMYLDAIARGETDGLPAVPNTRQEMYLDAIARNGGGAGSKIVAENYIETKPYAVGEHAVNGGKLYVKTSGAEVAEVWTPAHWTEITVGEELTRLSSSIADDLHSRKVVKTVSGTTIPLTEKGIVNVKTTNWNAQDTMIIGVNCFDNENAVYTPNGYASAHTITKEDGGIKIVTNLENLTSRYLTCDVTAEATGLLWFSCEADTDGDIKDVAANVAVNGVNGTMLYGRGHMRQAVQVVKGDTVTLKLYSHISGESGVNTIYYHKIMLSYGGDLPYTPYAHTQKNYTIERGYVKVNLPTAWEDLSQSSTSVSGKYSVYFVDVYAPESIRPAANSIAADITSNLDVTSWNAQFNATNGIAISTTGKIGLCVDGKNRLDMAAYLAEHPVWYQYEDTEGHHVRVNFTPADITTGNAIVFEESAQEVEYFHDIEKPRKSGICFGDSITGMFANKADYPSMLSELTDVDFVNVGFSGCRYTDHSGDAYKPFSMNRLVDAIIGNDYSMQDASDKVNPESASYDAIYAEHLAALKEFDFEKADFCTIYYGVNDWVSNVILKSEDDTSAANKQRTNVEDAIKYCVDKLLSAYPHLRIIVVTPYWWGATGEHEDSNVDPNTNGDYLRDYGAYMQTVAETAYNLPTVNLYNIGANKHTNRYFTQDGGHPTEMTKHIIARRIAEML